MGVEGLLKSNPSAFMGQWMTANVYIDGFNLYYCGVKSTPADKWLNLYSLSHILFPNLVISKIKYFSAKVKALSWDKDAPTRQNIYWRALKTIPNLEIIEGNFAVRDRWLPRYPYVYPANNPLNSPLKVRVVRTEEKGSDVNLASHLLYDNCIKDADESIVISNDADLISPIDIVTSKLGGYVTIVNPNRTSDVHKDRAHHGIHKELKRVATNSYPSINDYIFPLSQFSASLTDANGTFSKPPSWV
jgi:hypothetical protein